MMKRGINQWNFPGGTTPKQALKQAKDAGFDGVEICLDNGSAATVDISKKEAKAIRAYAKRIGIEITSVASCDLWSTNLGSTNNAERKRAKTLVSKCLQVANWMGTDAILLVPGVVTAEHQADKVVENSLKSIKELIPLAEDLKVEIGVENVWNKMLHSPTEMRDFVDQCESDFVKVYFDVGNMLVMGFPEHWIRILGDRINRIHMKDFKLSVGNIEGFCQLLEGDVNFPEVMKALHEIGYDGPLTAEIIPAYTHAPKTTLTHIKSSLDAIIAM